MKSIGWLVLGLAGITAVASPIPKNQVAADAKWVVHLDAEQLMRGKIGTFLVDNLLNPRSQEMREKVKQELGVEWDWKRIQSITAYGTGYKPQEDETGVLLIRTSMDVKAALDAAIEKRMPQLSIQKVEETSFPLYRLSDQGGFLGLQQGMVMVGRDRKAIDRSMEVLSGRAQSLEGAKALEDYPETSFGFFFLAVAEGFGQQAELPVSAAIFKQATGARLVLGEDNDRLRLNFDLKAATSEVTQQIAMVGQGLLALAAMNSGNNPDLQKLTQSAAVTSAGKCVTLAVTVPVADVIARINEEHSEP